MLLFYSTWFIILMLILCPPFGIILAWRNTDWSKLIKFLVSILSLIVCTSMLFGGILIFEKLSNTGEEPAIPDTPQVSEPAAEETEEPDVIEEESPDTTDAAITTTEEAIDLSTLNTEEKINYLLSRSVSDKYKDAKVTTSQFNPAKIDITVDTPIGGNENVLAVIQDLSQLIFDHGLKDEIMSVTVNGWITADARKIATIKDYSAEILPTIQCVIYDGGNLYNKSFTLNITETSKPKKENADG